MRCATNEAWWRLGQREEQASARRHRWPRIATAGSHAHVPPGRPGNSRAAGGVGGALSGQAVALVGPSGAGKSTLLHIAGLLETPGGGRVSINGADWSGLNDSERTRVRRTEMGFVYQFHQLLPEFSALENVLLPQMIRGVPRRAGEARAKQLLTMLGLGERLAHQPAQLSGGEQQRTAIAR